jgi:hypothetical protein
VGRASWRAKTWLAAAPHSASTRPVAVGDSPAACSAARHGLPVRAPGPVREAGLDAGRVGGGAGLLARLLVDGRPVVDHARSDRADRPAAKRSTGSAAWVAGPWAVAAVNLVGRHSLRPGQGLAVGLTVGRERGAEDAQRGVEDRQHGVGVVLVTPGRAGRYGWVSCSRRGPPTSAYGSPNVSAHRTRRDASPPSTAARIRDRGLLPCSPAGVAVVIGQGRDLLEGQAG